LLEQRVHEKPRVLDLAHAAARVQQIRQGLRVAVEQRIHQRVLAGVVVIQIARADVQFGREQRGRDMGFAKAIEQVQRGFENALGGAAWRFLGHCGLARWGLGAFSRCLQRLL